MAFGSFVSFLWAHCCFHLLWFDCLPLCPPTRSLALIRAHFMCSLLLILCHSCRVVGTVSLFRMLRWRGFFKPLQKLSIVMSPSGAHPALRTRLLWVAMYVSRSSPFILRVGVGEGVYEIPIKFVPQGFVTFRESSFAGVDFVIKRPHLGSDPVLDLWSFYE